MLRCGTAGAGGLDSLNCEGCAPVSMHFQDARMWPHVTLSPVTLQAALLD